MKNDHGGLFFDGRLRDETLSRNGASKGNHILRFPLKKEHAGQDSADRLRPEKENNMRKGFIGRVVRIVL
jgi:hypothetical protein